MTDLVLLDEYCEKRRAFIDPFLVNDVRARGLVWVIERLPTDLEQAKRVVRARLATAGRYVGDPEIEQYADRVARLEALRKELQSMNMADAHLVSKLLREMLVLTGQLIDSYD